MRIGGVSMRRVMTVVLVGFMLFGAGAHPRAQAGQLALIDQAIAAMGGEGALKNIRSLTLETAGHNWALEQSERPEGPWLSTYVQATEIRDYANNRRTVETQQRNWTSPKWSVPVSMVVADSVAARTNGQRWAAALPSDVEAWNETAALAPERLLFTARSASDLRALPDETLQRVRQNVLAFSRPGQKLKLYLNAWTHLPTALDIVKNDRWSIWGDVTERRVFGFWGLEAGGVMMPRQTTTEWNGLSSADETIETIAVNAPVDAAKFAIPDDAKAAFAKTASASSGTASVTLDETKAVAITAHIVQFPSGYNVTVIDQPDGLVILEATTSSAFSGQVIAAAEKRFPGKKVKAVVTTSDAWPHIGGIREYAARGIPIYALDLNVSILTRVLKAPHTFAPDALSKTPRAPLFHPITARTTIGAGDARMEAIPVRGENGERMMVVWFPGAKVLYSSDLIQRARVPKSFFWIEMPSEVVDTAAREHLDGIDRVFGMHLSPTPWSDVLAAVAEAKGK
jgi:glyoxylase-like metal-dependent hydrolase (beta-lactamase superfamily II)